MVDLINPSSLLNNADKLLRVYPELSSIIENIQKRVDNENICTSCAKRKHAKRILVALLKIRYDGRDLTLLSKFIPSDGIELLKSI